MKKYTSLATALCIATAFCGACAGLASNVKANAAAPDAADVPVVSVSADSTAKVILCPGRNYSGNEIVNNTISGDKVKKLTETEEKNESTNYWVENAYFANLSVGEDLPKPTSPRSDITFVGWRYAVDGEMVTVEKMPSVTETTILYAHWTAGSGSVVVPPTPDKPGSVTATGTKITFSDGVVILNLEMPKWGTDGPYLYMWNDGGDEPNGAWADSKSKGESVTASGKIADYNFIFYFKEDSSEKKTADLKLSDYCTAGKTYTVTVGEFGSGEKANVFTPVFTEAE